MFHDILFSGRAASNSSAKVSWSTSVVTDGAGREQRIPNWVLPVRGCVLETGNIRQSELDELLAFYRARQGRAHSFRFRCWWDCQGTDEPLGYGDGSTYQFQLVRRYRFGGSTLVLPVTKPVAGSVTVLVDGEEVMASVDTSTGVVTLTEPPYWGAWVTASFTFDIEARFLNDRLSTRLNSYLNGEQSVELTEVKPTLSAWTIAAPPQFIEARLPDYDYQSEAGPEYLTFETAGDAGISALTPRWTQSRGRYALDWRRPASEIGELHTAFMAARGQGIGFRLKDWSDYRGQDEQIGTGDGQTVAFSLRKTYFSGQDSAGQDIYHQRRITKPVAGSAVVRVDGQTVAFSLDAATGTVTLESPPASGAVVTADFEFDAPVRFNSDGLQIDWEEPLVASASAELVALNLDVDGEAAVPYLEELEYVYDAPDDVQPMTITGDDIL